MSGRIGGVRMTLAELPGLAMQWHPFLNGALSPSEILSKSNKKVWWRCDKGHDYDAVVANRVVLGRGCPYCARKKVGYGNDLASEFPRLAAEWHPVLNGDLTPAKVMSGSGQKVWWTCSAGHDYPAAVSKRSGERTGCPYCSGRVVGYGNDLGTRQPAVAAEWHPTRNGDLTPAQVTPGARARAWWVCPNRHCYELPVFKRTGGAGCPYCSGRRAGQGNDLAAVHPDLAGQWHPTRNEGLRPADVTPGSNKTVWWKCDRGHDFDAAVVNRVKNGDGCPFCSGQRIGYGNDFATLHPQLAAEWHPVRNGGLKPDAVRPKSHMYAWWRCLRCGHEWQAVISSRTTGKGCPPCGIKSGSAMRRLPAAGKSLAEERPDLAAEWDAHLNGDRTAQTVNTGSSDSAWWRCSNGHVWSAAICIRTRKQGGSNCPDCAGQRATIDNNLALRDSALSAQWHPTRNKPLTPDLVTPKSHKTVWWICVEGHSWRALVSSRMKGNGCPYCANQKVGYGNDLAARLPLLAAEWHPTRNKPLTPSQVVSGSTRKVWWKCDKGHTWHTTIDSRSGRGSGCPDCILAATSKLEIKIFAELQHVLEGHFSAIQHNPRVLAPPGRKLIVDMLFGDIIVEFDGAYWHRDSERRDSAKTARLAAAGFRVIRVREAPLDPIADHDLVLPASQSAHLTAGAVLAAMERRGWLPVSAGSDVRRYREQSTPRASDVADRMILLRLHGDRGHPSANVRHK
jgi:hypothetical protein